VSTDPKLVRDHFLAAAELPAAERGAYLTAHCGRDAELRAAVERLLAAHDQPASVLNRPAPGGLEQTAAYIPSEQPGTVVAGRYKLLEEIGEGGMGTVWVAEQTQPVRRKVALKLIKPGMDSKSVLARFDAERQALAVMDHPNIAKVFDGGLTETGRPFFVMEYVKGVPIKEAAWDEVRRIIREEEPPRPSARLSSSQALPSLAAGRQTEPARLTKLVRGELDWIVMKALEKDRTRRYETANSFATDIQHYLAGEPVLAAPPSARYRLRKFARKHRVALTTAAAIILLLLAGAAFSTWQAVRATRAEAAARAAEQQALQEKMIAQSVRDFLQNKLLGQADSRTQADALRQAGGLSEEARENPTIRELLDRAAKELAPEKIDANFPNQPLVQAEILQTVGNTYDGVGEYERAIGFLQRSAALCRQNLAPDHQNTLASMNNLAAVYRDAGKRELALPLLEQTLKFQKAKLGPEHPDTLASMNYLAGVYWDSGKRDLALPLYEETLKLQKARLGPEHPDTLTSMNNLATAYRQARQLDKSIPMFEETLKRQETKLGRQHPDTLFTAANLGAGRDIDHLWHDR
jgi:tetratricopeptide (TPR) repeat protein